MFRSVLIANRGEIACRIARTAKRLGMRTIAVYSTADAGALHVRSCDEAYCIGAAAPRESYLSIERLIEAAKQAGAECIHPGYGFLSENADFAEACAQAGIVFVGPPAAAIRAMGLKDRAKTLMEKARVPIVPGYHGERQDPKFLKEKAYEIGYPVLIKPAAGGGGRGMRRVDKHADFEAALEGAIRESQSAFGSSRVLIEKYIASPRHIEIQIFADRHGNAIHLGERDCSLQRRHQKVIEEAPAPGMTAELRAQIGATAVAAASAVGYCGAGTVEFVADGTGGTAGRRLLVHRNEYPAASRASGDRERSPASILSSGNCALPPARSCRLRRAKFGSTATPSKRAFMPRTPSTASCRRPARSWRWNCRTISASTAASKRAAKSRRSTMRCSPSLSRTRRRARRRLTGSPPRSIARWSRACAAMSRSSPSCAVPTSSGAAKSIPASSTAISPCWALCRSHATTPLRRSASRICSTPGSANEIAPLEDDALESDSPWAPRDGFQLGGVRSVAVAIVVDGESAVATVTYAKDGMRVAVDGAAPASDGKVFAAGQDAYVLRGGRQTRVRIEDFSTATA